MSIYKMLLNYIALHIFSISLARHLTPYVRRSMPLACGLEVQNVSIIPSIFTSSSILGTPRLKDISGVRSVHTVCFGPVSNITGSLQFAIESVDPLQNVLGIASQTAWPSIFYILRKEVTEKSISSILMVKTCKVSFEFNVISPNVKLK